LRYNRVSPELVTEVKEIFEDVFSQFDIKLRVTLDGDPPNIETSQSYIFIVVGEDIEERCS
jgi:hypothetical protein